MKTIWKYPLKVGGSVVRMPEGARVIRFAMQGAVPTAWALVESANALRPRMLAVFGTGHAIPPDAQYVGSTDDGPFVWHLFEPERPEIGEGNG